MYTNSNKTYMYSELLKCWKLGQQHVWHMVPAFPLDQLVSIFALEDTSQVL